MKKRIALVVGLVLVFMLSMGFFSIRAFLVPISARPMPDFPAAIALIVGVAFGLFGVNIVDRFAPVGTEKQ